VVGQRAQKRGIVVDPNAWILGGVTPRNGAGFIGAAVIDDEIFPIPIGLRQHAFDALGQMLGVVVERGQHADQGLGVVTHSACLRPAL